MGRVLTRAPVLVSLLACNSSRWLEDDGDTLKDLEEADSEDEGLGEVAHKVEELDDDRESLQSQSLSTTLALLQITTL